MFNRSLTVVNPTEHTTEYVTKEVHHHRAPTDKSVKLLREMEAAAKNEVIEAIHAGDTVFQCVIHMMKHFLDDSSELTAVFSLNGKKLTAKYRWHTGDHDKPEALRKLRDEVAQAIATEVLIPALHAAKL